MTYIYKISTATAWQYAIAKGAFTGAPIDIEDGYIHFSTAQQAKETAAKHFKGQKGLVLVAFKADTFGDALKWEPSRGGDLFPHLYATLPTGAALWVKPLPLDDSGNHIFPDMI